jgi:hypothetical protein
MNGVKIKVAFFDEETMTPKQVSEYSEENPPDTTR